MCHNWNHKGFFFVDVKGRKLGDIHASPEVDVYSRDENGLSDGRQEHLQQNVTR